MNTRSDVCSETSRRDAHHGPWARALAARSAADVAGALVLRLVGAGRHREHAAQLVDAVEPLARHPGGQPVEQRARVLGSVAQQRRGGHHHVRAGEQVLGDVGGVLDARGGRERGAAPCRAAARSRSAAAARRPGSRARRRATTASASGSMSGCRKRLNSTSASAPASSSRSAISPMELKYGLELDRDRHGDRGLDALQDVDVALLDVAAGDARVAGQVVDVQLDRGGAGVLHRARVVGPAVRA